VSKRKIATHFLLAGWNLLPYFVFSPCSTFLLEKRKGRGEIAEE
jgi:hypothetical protein